MRDADGMGFCELAEGEGFGFEGFVEGESVGFDEEGAGVSVDSIRVVDAASADGLLGGDGEGGAGDLGDGFFDEGAVGHGERLKAEGVGGVLLTTESTKGTEV